MTDEQLQEVINIISKETYNYKKGEILVRRGEKVNYIGIIISGSANIIKETYSGEKTIIKQITSGDVFGESLIFCEKCVAPVSIEVVKQCEIMKITSTDILNGYLKKTSAYEKILHNMIKMLSNKNIMLNKKIDILSERTTQEKLLTYFDDLAITNNKNTFTLPMSKSDLADYLCVERTAMSRVLKNMEDEKIIKQDKRKITLL